ncbi:PREDICTED: uncharacterized protein LOC104827231 [Tarenaya hassleriana]|uniref:uncharacterized protein LOC104827231 n=1 Tax=Tarenaya hassleriana TaxID=28532 RepID=UPI00053C9E2E|nr:PREDICTED: uncharacterized protein LOC104827231 [Tarenaya hassleriana]
MKTPTLLIAITLMACYATSHVHAAASASDAAQVQWFPFPYHHHRGWPFLGGALPPMPFHPKPFQPSPIVTKCLSHGGEVKACHDEIVASFFARKAVVGPLCCQAVMAIEGDCEQTVFGFFHNPFFNAFIKQHCSNQSPPSAPTPA